MAVGAGDRHGDQATAPVSMQADLATHHAEGETVGRVLDVAAGHEPPVVDQPGGADQVARVAHARATAARRRHTFSQSTSGSPTPDMVQTLPSVGTEQKPDGVWFAVGNYRSNGWPSAAGSRAAHEAGDDHEGDQVRRHQQELRRDRRPEGGQPSLELLGEAEHQGGPEGTHRVPPARSGRRGR